MIRTNSALLLAFMALTLIGCKSNPPEAAPAEPAEAANNATAEPTESKVLTIYSGRSEKLVGPVIKMFEEESGITVSVKYGKSGELAGTLLEEGQKSPADLFWAQDAGTLGVLSQRDMLTQQPQTTLDKVDKRFQSGDSKWVGTSGRARVLAYNTANVKEEDLPKSVNELTDPTWKGRVGWAPENASFQSFVAAMVETDGAEATETWLKGMVANEPKAYPKNTPAVAATGKGEVDVALVNHYYLLRLKKEHGPEFPVANHFFKDGKSGSLVNISGVATLKTAKNADNAAKFIDFLLGQKAQEYFAQQTFEYPVVSTVPAFEGLPALDTLNPPNVDFTKLSNLETTVKLLRSAQALP